MNAEMKTLIIEALNMKIASSKRAKNGANAKFATLYDEEIAAAEAAKTWINAQK
jgi:hypothetical protein